MTAVYAESSAVLRWFLGGAQSEAVRDALDNADAVFASELTSAEVRRALRRLAATEAISPNDRDLAFARYASRSRAGICTP